MDFYPKEKQQQLRQRWQDLKSARTPWLKQWKELSDYIYPETGNFFLNDTNKPRSRQKIFNSLPTSCVHILGAGMLAGASSPGRPWFILGIKGVDTTKNLAARKWCTDVRDLVLETLNKSGAYLPMQNLYEGAGCYGTSAAIVFEDEDTDIKILSLSIGSFALATDSKGQVNTLYREFKMTVRALVEEFGLENCTEQTQRLYQNRHFDEYVTVIHAIEPRIERDETKDDAANMPYASYYFEDNSTIKQFLRESGFKHFVAITPRWNVEPGNVYGTGPGTESLPDIKQLQIMEKRLLQGIDLTMNPPLQGPPTLRSRTINNFPGGYTVVDGVGNNPIKPLVNQNVDFQGCMAIKQEVVDRIKQAFHVDLFLMLQQDAERQMTATEVSERREEKMTVLGPVLLRLKDELLEPIVKLTYEFLLDHGKLPPLPQNLQDKALDIEFISMMAQAQKSSDITQMDRLLGMVQPMAQFDPTVLDYINFAKFIQTYASLIGVPPSVMNSEEDVATKQQQRQQAAQAQQQMEMLQQGSAAIKNIASAQQGQGQEFSAIDQMSGYYY